MHAAVHYFNTYVFPCFFLVVMMRVRLHCVTITEVKWNGCVGQSLVELDRRLFGAIYFESRIIRVRNEPVKVRPTLAVCTEVHMNLNVHF